MSNEFAAKDLTMGQLNALVKKLGGHEVALNILRGTVELVVKTISFIVATFTVMVDKTKSVDDLVKEGKFDWANEDVTSRNFPSPENGARQEEELILFHFNKTMSYDGVVAEMAQENCEPAGVHDLLAFAKEKPNLQRRFPIVALKSVWRDPDGNRCVPSLCSYASGRSLLLDCLDDGWGGRCRFLARRKKNVSA